jgi:o-succinylbenzoate synthase
MEIEPFSLPLANPLETAAGTIDAREGFVIRTMIDGVQGVGEATPLAGWTESIEACQRALEGVADPERALNDGSLDGAPAARHGVSLSVLDARARSTSRPLYQVLGEGTRVEAVPVNATVGDGDISETVDAVESAVSDGFSVIKLKVGSRCLEDDVDRLEAARSRHPDVELRVDANGAWNEATAKAACSRLAEIGVSVLEQPLPAARLDAHARLRDRGVEIALDESVSKQGPEAVLDAGAADLLVCKPMVLGGIDIAREMILSARRAGIDAIATTTIDGALARAAAVHLAASIPDIRACGLATGSLFRSDLRSSVALVSDGTATVPQGKGNIPPR